MGYKHGVTLCVLPHWVWRHAWFKTDHLKKTPENPNFETIFSQLIQISESNEEFLSLVS